MARTATRGTAAAVAALLLAACAGSGQGIAVGRVDHRALYSPGLVQWVAAGRDLPLVVVGGPTGEEGERWAAAVAAGLNGSNRLPTTRITTTPGDSARGNFHLAVVLNAGAQLTDRDACAAEPGTAPPGETSGGVGGRLMLVFCNDAMPVSSAVATTAPIPGPDEPRLAAALGQLLRQAMPREDPDQPAMGDVPLFP